MAKKIRTLLAFCLAIALASGCATAPKFVVVRPAEATECVVLLHGLNRTWRAMEPMAEALQEEGYATVNVDYPSRSGPIEDLVALSVQPGLEQCRQTGATTIHFVTHSLGGILLRFAQSQAPIPDLGRVVMLAPPNQGSEIIDKAGDWPGAILLGGEAGLQLGTMGENSIPARLGPVDFELGVIAGTGTINLFLSAMLPDPDDGKVSVANTKVKGMRDFMIVDDNHHTIMSDPDVIANTKTFLRTGKFLHLPGEG